jgi:uncharacterized BrkB/YihY/UPF0761 family membrane protein
MPALTLTVIRLMAVTVAFALSGAQFRFFDCNKMPALSVASGALTLLLVYAIAEATYRVATSARPTQEKLLTGAVVVLVGAGLMAAAGFFTLVTHICP